MSNWRGDPNVQNEVKNVKVKEEIIRDKERRVKQYIIRQKKLITITAF
jgi:hypothetical protein